MSLKKHKCEGIIFESFHNYPCGNNAKVERDDKWYCGIHDPERKRKKREAQEKTWEEESKKREKAFKRRSAEQHYCQNLDNEYLETHIGENKP